ncbi:hypothetical protein D9M71_376670 [compost metagenome]
MALERQHQVGRRQRGGFHRPGAHLRLAVGGAHQRRAQTLEAHQLALDQPEQAQRPLVVLELRPAGIESAGDFRNLFLRPVLQHVVTGLAPGVWPRQHGDQQRSLRRILLQAHRMQPLAQLRIADHLEAPGLQVAGAGRENSHLQAVADHFVGHRLGREATHRPALLDQRAQRLVGRRLAGGVGNETVHAGLLGQEPD